MHRADVPDIRAKELLTVVTLAEYGSFVAAAAHLKTSQPALTRTVKRVERVLGVTLFARNTRRVEISVLRQTHRWRGEDQRERESREGKGIHFLMPLDVC